MKYRLMFLEIWGLFFFFSCVQGQYRTDHILPNNERVLTGSLHADLFPDTESDFIPDSTKQKVVYKRIYSPMRAGLFSIVIPGAGQFYTKSYWQGIAFFSAEVLLWTAYAIYEHKGDQKTDEFQNYANEHWSAINYTNWMATYYPTEAAALGITNPVTQTPAWSTINALESKISETPATGFTHKLDTYGAQQYYEMIGKYAQFIGGWDDAWNGSTSLYDTHDVFTENVSPNFSRYSVMRGDANSLYNIATTASYVIVANHVLSALEAAWNASKLNHRVKLQGHIESRRVYGNLVEFVPTLHVNYEL